MAAVEAAPADAPFPTGAPLTLPQHETACRQGEAQSCIAVGDWWAQQGKRASSSEAWTKHLRACRAAPRVCAELARRYAVGDRVEAAPRRSAIFLRMGCEHDDTVCEVAEEYVIDRRVPMDAPVTFELSKLVCKRLPSSCAAFARAFDTEDGRSHAWAAQFKAAACHANKASCVRGAATSPQAQRQSRIEAARDARDADKATAVPWSKRTSRQLEFHCPATPQTLDPYADPEVCLILATRYRDGIGVERDPARAAKYLARACTEADSAEACYRLAAQYRLGVGVRHDFPRAAKLYARACDQQHALACWRLARDYAGGLGVARDVDRARALFDRACNDGIQTACHDRKRLRP